MDINECIEELKKRILNTTDEDKLYKLVKELYQLLYMKRKNKEIELISLMTSDINEKNYCLNK
jgi:hypothetical protein